MNIIGLACSLAGSAILLIAAYCKAMDVIYFSWELVPQGAVILVIGLVMMKLGLFKESEE